MTQKEKELLLQDLSERLPYSLYIWVEEFSVPKTMQLQKVFVGNYLKDNRCSDYDANALLSDLADGCINVKPYLRPMSSMTEEEKKIQKDYYIYHFSGNNLPNYEGDFVFEDEVHEYIDWLNAHHFDYRGLIEKGLALEAPEGMYK